MSYIMGREKGSKGQKFASIIRVKCLNDGGEMVFNKLLEGDES